MSLPKRRDGKTVTEWIIVKKRTGMVFASTSIAAEARPRGYKTFFMLNSVEHAILNVHTLKVYRNSAFLGSVKPRMLFFQLINVKMPTIVGILTFMSRKKFMLN